MRLKQDNPAADEELFKQPGKVEFDANEIENLGRKDENKQVKKLKIP